MTACYEEHKFHAKAEDICHYKKETLILGYYCNDERQQKERPVYEPDNKHGFVALDGSGYCQYNAKQEHRKRNNFRQEKHIVFV